LRITGSSGQEHDILAERFRLAIGSRIVRSTDCDIRVLKDEVVFENGRGFGHGLGLCQWGAQGQALEGKRAGEILRFYYPGSRLTRVY
jgi:stage II sporulation protein D